MERLIYRFKHATCIKTNSWFGRLLIAIPVWARPFWILPVRVGRDITTYSKLEWK